ncbi:SAM domain-containing protein, partial [Rhizobiaceae sp. 2RAB30]
MDIARWLPSPGLGNYAPTIAQNEITPEVTPHLSDADLEAADGPAEALVGRDWEIPNAPEPAGPVPSTRQGAQ